MTPQLMPLILRHSEERDNENGGDPLKHAQISVAYAIEMLEYMQKEMAHRIDRHQISIKIAELKKQL